MLSSTPTPIAPSTIQTDRDASDIPISANANTNTNVETSDTEDETSMTSPPSLQHQETIEYVYDDIESIYNRPRLEHGDSTSFNIYNGETFDSPESGKVYSGPVAHIVLFSILCIILGLIAFLTVSSRATLYGSDDMPSSSPPSLNGLHSHCHYDDGYFPIDKQCGVHICDEKGIDQVLTLKLGWSDSLVQQRKYNAYSLLYDIHQKYGILPDELMLNTMGDQDEYMVFENISIALGHIELDLMHFCCYDSDEYHHIKQLFDEFHWSEFDVTFGNYTCLNMTEQDETDYVMLLDEESQSKIRRWVDNFEDYLNYHRVEVKVGRIDGQLYGSTFARFDGYNEWMETVSLDEVRGLNGKYKGDWSDIKVSVSKHNLLMT